MSFNNANNIIYISSKKNIIFFLNIAKAYLENHDQIVLKACGSAMSTAMIIVEMLKTKNFFEQAYYETETILSNGQKKTQLNIHLDTKLKNKEEPETNPPDQNFRPVKIYVSLNKSIAFYIHLIEETLEASPCEILGTGRCISNIIVLYEHFRTQKHFLLGNLKTCSKYHLLDQITKTKTECSVTLQTVEEVDADASLTRQGEEGEEGDSSGQEEGGQEEGGQEGV